MIVDPQALVSVVVCNYNYGKYIAEAIGSVLGQSYRNLQLVVVDDGSTDLSREILASIDDSRLEIILQDNAGQAAAFNQGFEACRGEFVAFLDSDDFWYRNKLEVTLREFTKGNISLVQHNLDLVDSNSQPTGGVTPNFGASRHTLQSSYFRKRHTGFFSPTSGLVCRRSDLEEIFPIESRWKICADVALTRPLPLFGDIVMLRETLGAYRVHESNNWVGTAQSKNWVENQARSVQYANDWLARRDIAQRIKFEGSLQYHYLRSRDGLPIPSWAKLLLWGRGLLHKLPIWGVMRARIDRQRT